MDPFRLFVKFKGGHWHRAARHVFHDDRIVIECRRRGWWWHESDLEVVTDELPAGATPGCSRSSCLLAHLNREAA